MPIIRKRKKNSENEAEKDISTWNAVQRNCTTCFSYSEFPNSIEKGQQERKGVGGYASSVKLNLTDHCHIVLWQYHGWAMSGWRAGSPSGYCSITNSKYHAGMPTLNPSFHPSKSYHIIKSSTKPNYPFSFHPQQICPYLLLLHLEIKR